MDALPSGAPPQTTTPWCRFFENIFISPGKFYCWFLQISSFPICFAFFCNFRNSILLFVISAFVPRPSLKLVRTRKLQYIKLFEVVRICLAVFTLLLPPSNTMQMLQMNKIATLCKECHKML